jgi:hypothetical protein
MKTLKEFMAEAEQHFDHRGNPITMQDIRLMAGEGKLSKKTTHQAVSVIKKQRKERDDLMNKKNAE